MSNTCYKCGNNLYGNKSKCPFCGAPIRGGSAINENRVPVQKNQYQYANNPNNPNGPVDQQQYTHYEGGVGWFILGFCLPIVGIIVALFMMGTKPVSAKTTFIGAVVSILFSFMVTIFSAMA